MPVSWKKDGPWAGRGSMKEGIRVDQGHVGIMYIVAISCSIWIL